MDTINAPPYIIGLIIWMYSPNWTILLLFMIMLTNNISTGASVTGVFVDKPRIFGTATDADIVKTFDKHNILTMDNGTVAGMNGVIIGIAKLRGMQGTCLLGETSGYVVDAKASKSILETLLSILRITVDMTNLEKKAKDTEMLIKTIEQQMAGRTFEGQQPGIPAKPANTGYIS
jgi:uncharacterized protein